MTVKSSISLSEKQHGFAEDLVDAGQFGSISAVVQQSLSLLEQKIATEQLESAALAKILALRQNSPTLPIGEFEARIDSALAEKRKRYGLGG